MAIRYVSFDIREGQDSEGLQGFLESNNGEKVTESLYRFETSVELKSFVGELRDVVQEADQACVIFKGKDGDLRHMKAS